MSSELAHTVFKAYLDELLGSWSELGGLEGDTVAAHALTVTGELEGKVLLPQGADVVVAQGSQLLGLQATLLLGVHIHLLNQDSEGSLCGLTHLLKHTLGLK